MGPDCGSRTGLVARPLHSRGAERCRFSAPRAAPRLCHRLAAAGFEFVVIGGWAVDICSGHESREHKDRRPEDGSHLGSMSSETLARRATYAGRSRGFCLRSEQNFAISFLLEIPTRGFSFQMGFFDKYLISKSNNICMFQRIPLEKEVTLKEPQAGTMSQTSCPSKKDVDLCVWARDRELLELFLSGPCGCRRVERYSVADGTQRIRDRKMALN